MSMSFFAWPRGPGAVRLERLPRHCPEDGSRRKNAQARATDPKEIDRLWKALLGPKENGWLDYRERKTLGMVSVSWGLAVPVKYLQIKHVAGQISEQLESCWVRWLCPDAYLLGRWFVLMQHGLHGLRSCCLHLFASSDSYWTRRCLPACVSRPWLLNAAKCSTHDSYFKLLYYY